MVDNLNLEKRLVQAGSVDQNDDDVKQILEITRKALEMMPDIHKIE